MVDAVVAAPIFDFVSRMFAFVTEGNASPPTIRHVLRLAFLRTRSMRASHHTIYATSSTLDLGPTRKTAIEFGLHLYSRLS